MEDGSQEPPAPAPPGTSPSTVENACVNETLRKLLDLNEDEFDDFGRAFAEGLEISGTEVSRLSRSFASMKTPAKRTCLF